MAAIPEKLAYVQEETKGPVFAVREWNNQNQSKLFLYDPVEKQKYALVDEDKMWLFMHNANVYFEDDLGYVQRYDLTTDTTHNLPTMLYVYNWGKLSPEVVLLSYNDGTESFSYAPFNMATGALMEQWKLPKNLSNDALFNVEIFDEKSGVVQFLYGSSELYSGTFTRYKVNYRTGQILSLDERSNSSPCLLDEPHTCTANDLAKRADWIKTT